MIEEKTLVTLEYPKILEQLAGYADFSASAELARALRPAVELDDVLKLQARTTEARKLLSIYVDISVGGVRDIRDMVDLAAHAGVLSASDLLVVKTTLSSGRDLARLFTRDLSGTAGRVNPSKEIVDESEPEKNLYPVLSAIAEKFSPPPGIIDLIGQAISENGEVLDNASAKLASIRRDIKISHDRLLTRLEKLVNDSRYSAYLQDQIITQRDGRYVIPLRAECKSKIRAIVHDQSASGATLFVEPLTVVDLNNRWQELRLAEREEERRILAEISSKIGEHARHINNIVNALAEFDLALMCAKYADDMNAVEPLMVKFKEAQENHPGSTVFLRRARHPLLNWETSVPVDIVLEKDVHALVITGPNTGGKTVTLKTVGLLALMAQSGLHIPAQSGSSLSVFRKIHADIGDEQSIEQSLSTFSGHIRNIVDILQRVERQSLVLFDELGAGTDPQEGAALARALLDYLMKKRVTCLVATHYPELKTYAHATSGIVNASMEFDLETLSPTYHLIIGLPGRSNALLIAERLGLPANIIQDARSVIRPDDLKADDLLDEIHLQRDLARRTRLETEEAHQAAIEIRQELTERLEEIEGERLEILEAARLEAKAEVEDIRDQLSQLKRELRQARQPVEVLEAVQKEVEAIQEQVEEKVERMQPVVAGQETRPLRIGDKVYLRSIKMEGVVTDLEDDEIEVQLGSLRMRAGLEDVQRPSSHAAYEVKPVTKPNKKKAKSGDAAPASPPKKQTRAEASYQVSPGVELDLRGHRADEALDKLEDHIEAAYVARQPFVRVIHGKGTGKLRQVVREAAKGFRRVKRWEAGQEGEGGEGVTVLHIASD